MRLSRYLLASSLLLAAWSTPAGSQEPPHVVASIKPIHSLVAAVMQGIGEPALIVKGSGSEHIYNLKPSDARAIESAKLIFWAGPHMETFLAKPLESLGGGAKVVTLEEAEGLALLDFREGGPFEAHVHGDEEHAHDAGEDGHGHEEAHAHEKGHEGHDHGEHDLHFWLDPVNAKALARQIAGDLAKVDPANADRYRENADALQKKLDALTTEIEATLQPVKGRPYIVFHDAYQYFEKRFGMPASGSITVSPETIPGAQRVSQIHDKVRALGAACVFAEPQFEPKLVQVVTEGTDARSGVLDPLGAELQDGPELYFGLIRNLAQSLKDCLGRSS